MAEQKQVGSVTYTQAGKSYFTERGLRRYARVWSLWALGVGAVISGDFFGWNFGLAAGGFWGLAIATLVVSVMYVCMVFSIAELTAALPHAGGFYSFVRNALGPTWGYLCGVTDTIEYVITPAVIAIASRRRVVIALLAGCASRDYGALPNCAPRSRRKRM